MTTRHLATIERIADIRSIPDADAIEAAVVRGWTVVVKKGEFAIGDRCVYFEIDSFLPHVGPFEFLASRGSRIFDDVRGHVLRTIRLRGVYSQGLVLPLAAFPELTGNDGDGVGEDGRDVSDELGVTKYEAPLPASLSGIALGEFPTRLAPKTDSERVQNLVTSWDHLCTYGSWVATEKIDGSSMTVINDDGTIRVCSRNLELADVASNTL